MRHSIILLALALAGCGGGGGGGSPTPKDSDPGDLVRSVIVLSYDADMSVAISGITQYSTTFSVAIDVANAGPERAPYGLEVLADGVLVFTNEYASLASGASWSFNQGIDGSMPTEVVEVRIINWADKEYTTHQVRYVIDDPDTSDNTDTLPMGGA